MRILKAVVIVLIALALIFFVGGMFLPDTYKVTRSKLINAPTSRVFDNVANFNNFLKWNPWTKMAPSAQVTITGEPARPGHTWKWKGKETGEGQMEIKEVQPDSKIVYLLTFETPYESTADNIFQFKPSGSSTMVTWTMSGGGNSILEKWMYLSMDAMLGKDFEDGLNSLRKLSEQTE